MRPKNTMHIAKEHNESQNGGRSAVQFKVLGSTAVCNLYRVAYLLLNIIWTSCPYQMDDSMINWKLKVRVKQHGNRFSLSDCTLVVVRLIHDRLWINDFQIYNYNYCSILFVAAFIFWCLIIHTTHVYVLSVALHRAFPRPGRRSYG